MKRTILIGIFLAILVVLSPTNGRAAHLVSYQGVLTNLKGSPLPDSTYSVKFSIFSDSIAGQLLWTETAPVTTEDGLFTILLGTITPLTDFIFQNYDAIFLELSFSGQAALPRHRLAETPFSASSGNLTMKDNQNRLAAITNANKHSLSILDSTGTTVIKLSGTDTANQSVQLPESAIDFSEILDEPGLTQEINIDQVALFTGDMTDLVTLDITIPADGFILLHGKCYLLLSGTTGPNNAFIQIDDDDGGPAEFPYYTIAGLGGYANTATSYFPIYVTRAFFAQAGTYTFRMEGRASFPPPAEAKTWDHILTAVYYPTAYSAVKSLVTNPAGYTNPHQLNVNNRTDSKENGTYYKVDLRSLEKNLKNSNKTQP